MTAIEGPGSAGLVTRVQNILMHPAAEWDVIAGESASVPGLYTGYICILAAIPAIAGVLGNLLLSHWLIIPALIGAVVGYALALVGVFVVAFIVDALATSFGAEKNQVQALKLVAYSYTASWVAGVFLIIPFLGGLLAAIGGLYSLYLMYLGLPKLMKAPADKTVGYFVVTLLAAIAVYIVIGIVIGIFAAMAVVGAAATGAATLGSLSTH
ncbi:MAG TPA: Yip1 family protein [Caulobacteraceae bacterium]|nr:Yip1 family protein [Caulobacteraceae bacterium]